MTTDALVRTTTDGVLSLRFNRPHVLNAFDAPLFDATAAALHGAAADDAVAAVLITGTGRAFSSGLDLTAQDRHATGRAFEAFVDALAHCPKPIVAAVNGLAVGIGFTMLGLCDIVLLSSDARLRLPFVELGLTAEAGSSATLAWALGSSVATRLLLTGAWTTAEEVVALGLGWKAVPPSDLAAEATATATAFSELSRAAVRTTKGLLIEARRDALAAARRRETEAMARLATTAEHRAAIDRFALRSRGSPQTSSARSNSDD